MKETVLVTGSSRGIGRAVALKFASCGYRIVINCARSTDRLEEVKKEAITLLEQIVESKKAIGADYSGDSEFLDKLKSK